MNKRWFIITAAALALDQIIKALVLLFAEPGGIIVLAYNTGVTFGFMPGANGAMIWVSIIAAIAVGWALTKSEKQEAIGFAVLLGGILGNLVDRVIHGAVVDYIRIGSFPVFNLADACIVGGVIYLLLIEIPTVKKLIPV